MDFSFILRKGTSGKVRSHRIPISYDIVEQVVTSQTIAYETKASVVIP